jgi:hypothetical protein
VLGNQCLWPFFVGSNLSLPSSFRIFEKYQFAQILVEQRKIEVLLKKPCHFSEKNISKIGKKLRIFEFFFL